MEVTVTDSNFQELLNEGKPIVLDFWATWCGPCRKIAPDVEAIAHEYEGRVIVGKCDVDENADLPIQYNVRNIPTVLFIKEGQVVDKTVGAVSKKDLVERVEKLL